MPSDTDGSSRNRRTVPRPEWTRRGVALQPAERSELRTVLKLALGAGALLFVLALVSILPGLERLVRAPFGAPDLLVAAATLAVVAAALEVAPRVERIVRGALRGPEELVASVASVSKHLVVLAAVLVAHGGFGGVVVPVLSPVDARWAYDVLFLAIGLVPVGLVAVALYGALDPAARELTSWVASNERTDGDADDPGTDARDDAAGGSP